ncbi:MAG: hypothetical protein UX80_C0003G0073 [Candidatus Amesbacteria bacterium GW2011_GWA2_47_11b]|uniref:Uncharacterized protein n=1 Tax=Candidatus Amesbacteria bacterium GW2011_GWA2_47_11b TaxID=1618358 RepID=A0A0G1TW98_9BACT|nr:MAG: hypothetical protein UX80_C0003G0073 [Candidatus Amesbacteria bacterium GW2011_GWA2_47_11b]
MISGRGERRAIQVPKMRAAVASAATIRVVLRVMWPRVLSSVNRWGFQWGMYSVTKWESRARGREMRGSGMAVAIAAPMSVWGSSNIECVMILA